MNFVLVGDLHGVPEQQGGCGRCKDRGTGESYIEIEYIRIAIFLIFFIYFTNNS